MLLLLKATTGGPKSLDDDDALALTFQAFFMPSDAYWTFLQIDFCHAVHTDQ